MMEVPIFSSWSKDPVVAAYIPAIKTELDVSLVVSHFGVNCWIMHIENLQLLMRNEYLVPVVSAL